jgi:TatD DNase family protein
VVNPGCDVVSSRAAAALAERYDFLYAAVGIHPESCGGVREEDFAAIRALCARPGVVAVGEIGLDYYWENNPPRREQQAVFRRQLELAGELSLPVIVHDREAHGDALAIVREFPGVRGVFHCFSGSPEMARELLALGWYLGFDGPVTYKNARRAPEVAAAAPGRTICRRRPPRSGPAPRRRPGNREPPPGPPPVPQRSRRPPGPPRRRKPPIRRKRPFSGPRRPPRPRLPAVPRPRTRPPSSTTTRTPALWTLGSKRLRHALAGRPRWKIYMQEESYV